MLSRIRVAVRRIGEMTATNESNPCVCRRADKAARARSGPIQSFLDAAGWLVPGAVFAAMPKCPACLAAYLAAASGIGISLPAADLIRSGTLGLCLVLLAFLSARQICRLCAKS
jgi:hypothetical protein